MTEFRAGAVSLPLEPPLGLPMVGFVRQPWNARGYGLPLEVGALVLERGDTRVVVCGVDVVGIIHPQIEALIDRIAAATGADPAGILVNLSHTHLAPPGGVANGAVYGDVDDETAASIEAFSRVLHDKIVSACGLAAERLEPARDRLGPGGRRPRRQSPRADGGRVQRRLDPRLEPGRARRQPGDGPAGAAARRVRALHGRRLRLPPGHDRLRHGRVLGRLPRPDAGRRPQRVRRRVRLPAGRRRQRVAEVRVYGQRGRGAPDGDAARARRAGSRRRPLQPSGRGGARAGRVGDADHALPPPVRRGRRGAGARGRERDRLDSVDASPAARADRGSAPRVRRRAGGGARLRRPRPGQARPLPGGVGAPRSSRSSATAPPRPRCVGRCTRFASATA